MSLSIRKLFEFRLESWQVNRSVDLDELNNVYRGTFKKFPLSTEIFALENLAKILENSGSAVTERRTLE